MHLKIKNAFLFFKILFKFYQFLKIYDTMYIVGDSNENGSIRRGRKNK